MARWKRRRFKEPAPRRPQNYRKHHLTEVWKAVADGVISRQAATYHVALIDHSNGNADELDWIPLRQVATELRASVRTVSRWRQECVRSGFESHEHRCKRQPDGSMRGLPNRIRFTLPATAKARVQERLAAGRTKAGGKARPTPKAPQNQGQGREGAVHRVYVLDRLEAARKAGKTCPDGCDQGWARDGQFTLRCQTCSGTGVDPKVVDEVYADP